MMERAKRVKARKRLLATHEIVYPRRAPSSQLRAVRESCHFASHLAPSSPSNYPGQYSFAATP